VPREWRLRLDPLLLLATLGLVAGSLIALNGATENDVLGEPRYYVYRQAAYAGVGLVLMYAVSRIDYSRLRELRYPI
jgi:rod shape determining protein RodA